MARTIFARTCTKRTRAATNKYVNTILFIKYILKKHSDTMTYTHIYIYYGTCINGCTPCCLQHLHVWHDSEVRSWLFILPRTLHMLCSEPTRYDSPTCLYPHHHTKCSFFATFDAGTQVPTRSVVYSSDW